MLYLRRFVGGISIGRPTLMLSCRCRQSRIVAHAKYCRGGTTVLSGACCAGHMHLALLYAL